jgi:hypothetical protein
MAEDKETIDVLVRDNVRMKAELDLLLDNKNKKKHKFVQSTTTLNERKEDGSYRFIGMFHYVWEAEVAADALNKAWEEKDKDK